MIMRPYVLAGVGCFVLLMLSGCSAQLTDSMNNQKVANPTSTVPTVSPQTNGVELIPDGWRVWEPTIGTSTLVTGDLNQDGMDDQAAVIEQNGLDLNEMEAPKRMLRIVLKQSGGIDTYYEGQQAILLRNEGGVWGDPFDSIEIRNGSIYLKYYGGSNWRWTQRYQFRFQDGDFYLIGATFGLSFTGTNTDQEESDYNLLTGDRIRKKMDEQGNWQETKDKHGKKPLIKLQDFVASDGEAQL